MLIYTSGMLGVYGVNRSDFGLGQCERFGRRRYFFAHTDLAYGVQLYKNVKKKIHKEKSKRRHAVSKTALISTSFLELYFTTAVSWFGNLVPCIGTTMPRLVFVKQGLQQGKVRRRCH